MSQKNVLFNLHLLRAIAALGVVFFHITSDAGLNLPINIGAHGVDVFFVISGFIIAYIGTRSPHQFLIRRFIRIVPFYWTATLVVFTAALLLPHLFRSTQPDFVQLLCSLLFIPRETSYAGMFPTLLLGWSLNYEMYFYLVFALALLISKKNAPLLCSAAITLIAVAIGLSGVEHPSIRFYARPLVFEFIFGIAVFYIFTFSQRRSVWFTQHPRFKWILWCLVALAVVALGVEEFNQSFGLPRFIAAGIPASLLVSCALLLEDRYRASARSNVVFLVGESSYILYLIHPYVIYGVLRTVFAHHHVASVAALVCLISGLLILSTIVAVLIHLWFEKPVMGYLRRVLLDRSVRVASESHK